MYEAVQGNYFSLEVHGKVSPRFEEQVLQIDPAGAFEIFSQFTAEILTDDSIREIFRLSFQSFFPRQLISGRDENLR